MTRYISNENFVVSNSCGEAVIAPLSTDTADMGSLIALNETGAAIVSMMQEGKTISEMAATIASEYDAPSEDQLRTDIVAFADKLVKKGFFHKA